VHPFSSGSGADVRITTRTSEARSAQLSLFDDPRGGACLLRAEHRAGYRLSVLGQGVSMGVHESQSRIYENQLGALGAPSPAGFTVGCATSSAISASTTPEAFYAAVNRVHLGLHPDRGRRGALQPAHHAALRPGTRADRGRPEVADLEAAWNDRFAADFGVAVDRPRHGMLQDVHWSVGLFGYFPTYSWAMSMRAACTRRCGRSAGSGRLARRRAIRRPRLPG
jgi:carboxypeptidase Taq